MSFVYIYTHTHIYSMCIYCDYKYIDIWWNIACMYLYTKYILYIFSMEFYSAIKNEILPFLATWVGLKDIKWNTLDRQR